MSRTLYLLRHAKSSWDDPSLRDRDRPLAPRGERASNAIAEHVRSQRIVPALVLCSSARRTAQTLERVAAGFYDRPRIEIEDGLYAASADDLLARLHEIGDDVDSAMLVGHDPALQDLALSLARRGTRLADLREKFPTAALATLTFRGAWRELAPRAAELVAFVKPRELDGSGRG
jgi:phosphohistidine phosphatase